MVTETNPNELEISTGNIPYTIRNGFDLSGFKRVLDEVARKPHDKIVVSLEGCANLQSGLAGIVSEPGLNYTVRRHKTRGYEIVKDSEGNALFGLTASAEIVQLNTQIHFGGKNLSADSKSPEESYPKKYTPDEPVIDKTQINFDIENLR